MPSHARCVADLKHRLDGGQLFTRAAEEISGARATAQVLRSGRRPLSEDEAYLLEADPASATGLRGVGQITVLDEPAARVLSVVLVERIHDPDVVATITLTDIPLGAALEPLGVRRQPLLTRSAVGAVALRARGLLWLPRRHGCRCPGRPGEVAVALAEEQVLRRWLEIAPLRESAGSY